MEDDECYCFVVLLFSFSLLWFGEVIMSGGLYLWCGESCGVSFYLSFSMFSGVCVEYVDVSNVDIID